MTSKQEVNVPLVTTVGMIGGFLVLILTVGVQAWFLYEVDREIAIKWENSVFEPATSIKAEQSARLNEVGKNETGGATLPIREAFGRVVAMKGMIPKPPATAPTTAPVNTAK